MAIIQRIDCVLTPADDYLIDCGSLTNTTIGNRVFIADDCISSWTLKSSSGCIKLVPVSSLKWSFQTMILWGDWRTWEAHDNHLLLSSASQAYKYPTGKIKCMEGVTQEIATNIVYATARELSSASQNTLNFLIDVSWKFDVDAKYNYMIRFHFCDKVSLALNELLFNVYINSWIAESNLDLSAITHDLATAVFIYYVLGADDASDTLTITTGPSNVSASSCFAKRHSKWP
ncbi:hypothetical protein Cni_G25047 [Canna indica]|uniref:Malectin-like domain-containing protein n=1 Tax=Canna indica TaxID=4628 RepID=A0AAQ3QQ57_9LILI|nr:hypothetical protein Cni_G25047 [Canna indica]